MTALDSWLFYLFFIVAVILGIVAFFTLVSSLFPVREVVFKNEKGNWKWFKVKEVPADKLYLVKKARRRKAIVGISAFLVLGIVGSYVSWAIGSGELAAQQKVQAEESLDISIETYNVFAEPLTREDAAALTREGILRAIYAPNGESFEAEMYVSQGFFVSGNRLTYREDSDRTKAAELGVVLDREAQLAAQAQGVVYRELESVYGVFLTDSQRAELAVPTEAPEHLTRYGTTPITSQLADGTYFNGTATLIWDGEYKLIGSEGTDHAAELTRK